MKKYVKPILRTEEFVPQEYIAACGDSGKEYLFECNAGNKWDHYAVFTLGSDGIAGTEDDVQVGFNYHPCGKKHKASSDSNFYNGYMRRKIYDGDDDDDDYTLSETKEDVIIWRGEKNNNCHCTTQLDMNQWETAKS